MKKLYILLFSLLISSASFGQEMLLNGDFESWDNPTSPTNWTKVENTTQESTAANIHGGIYSAKHVGGTKDLGQTITGIVPGNSYTLTLWYKVGIVGDGTDARIWSYWKTSAGVNIDNNDYNSEDAIRGPNNSYLDNNGGVWTTYTATITAPATAAEFYFEVRTYSGATVYWDDLSFFDNTTASVKENQIEGFSLYPNPVANGEFRITTALNTEKEVRIFNMLGKQVYNKTVKANESINVANLTTGVYFVNVVEEGKTATKKLVVK